MIGSAAPATQQRSKDNVATPRQSRRLRKSCVRFSTTKRPVVCPTNILRAGKPGARIILTQTRPTLKSCMWQRFCAPPQVAPGLGLAVSFFAGALFSAGFDSVDLGSADLDSAGFGALLEESFF